MYVSDSEILGNGFGHDMLPYALALTQFLNSNYDGVGIAKTLERYSNACRELLKLYQKSIISKGEFYREQKELSTCYTMTVAILE